MADCDSGLTFAREGKADCTHVKETCAYATCDDTTGSHCYGLDSSLGYPAGYLNTSFSTKCEGDWKCPLAWQYGYPIGLQDTPPCCEETGKVMACPDNICDCYEVSVLAATLTPLSTSTPSATPTASSSSSPGTTSAPLTSVTAISELPRSTQGPSPTTAPTSGLSTGAKAGIGVGAALGGAAVFGLIFWLALALRKRRKETANLSPGVDTGEPEWRNQAHDMRDSHQGVAMGPGEPPRMTGR